MTNDAFSVNGIGTWMTQIEMFLSVILILFVLILFFSKREKNRKEKTLYVIIFAIAMLLFTDVVAIAYFGRTGQMAVIIEIVADFAYYTSNYVASWCMVRYALEVVRMNGKMPSKKLSFVNNSVFVIAMAAIILNLEFEFFYYIDAQNIYHRGPVFMLALAPVAVMMIVLVIALVIYKKNMTAMEYITILSYIILPVTAEIFQVIDYGIAWEPLAMAFSAFIIITHNILANPSKSSHINSEAYNRDNKILQTRILLFVCILIIVFFGFISRVAISFASIQMNEEIEAHYQMLANKTTEQASAWIVREIQILLNQKASLEIINNFDHEFLTEYFTYVVQDYNYDHYIYDIYFVNTENQMSDGSGYVQDPSIDFRERDWYTGAMSSDNMCYTVPYVDVDSGKFVVTVSIKVFDRNRKFVGVLALDMFVDKLFRITDQQTLPESSYLFIVDNEMGLVTHPSEAFAYVDESPQNLINVSVDNYKELANYIKEEQHSSPYIYFTDYDGQVRCFFVSKMEDCDWYIVAAISKEVIDQSRNNLGKSIFVALIVCLILGIIITLWATNNIIRKLTEAQEAANAASEAKSRFLANMSHEIRTPINAVLGMDEILLRECKDESLKEYAKNIQSAGQALLGVVNDILDFSKIESDKLELVNGDYVVGELIGSCINLIKLRAQDKGIDFKVEKDDYIPKTIYGDVTRVRQVITNLLTNAVKYTKVGEIVFSVGWEKTSDDTGELLISVKDTGIGIEADKIDDLFTSFQRLDEKKNRNIEGTGLGLSITKQLVELMGGQITVTSKYGVGSEFAINIPQKIIDASNTESFEVLHDNPNSAYKELHTKNTKILVVDDVVMNLHVVKGLLKDTGIEIDVAQRGKEAIEMIVKNQYDMVFLDHMMPEMDGVETLQLLKQLHSEVIENLPVIMLTANAVLGVEQQYKDAGFSGYLSKPIDRNALCDCILSFLPSEKLLSDAEYMLEAGSKDNLSVKESQEEHSTQQDSTKQDSTDIHTEETNTIDERTKASSANDEIEAEDHDSMILNYLQKNVASYEADQAVLYCGGMKDMVVEMLDEYRSTGLGEKLANAFSSENIADYRIHAHSMKSTSLTLGFVELSEQAKALEFAARDEDWNYIKENHETVYELYMKVLECLDKAFSL